MNQIKDEEYIIPIEEANEVASLLVEPQNDGISVDGILCSHDDKLKQDTKRKDVTDSFEGWPAYNATEEGEDISKPNMRIFPTDLHVLDAVPLQVVGRNHFSTTCEDYLLESFCNLDYNDSQRLNFDNSVSQSMMMEFIHPDNLDMDKSICELNSESRNKEKLDEGEMKFSDHTEIAQNSNSSALIRQKRLRKPTRRYMDELSDQTARFCRKRRGNFGFDSTISTSEDRFREVKFRTTRQVGTRQVVSTDVSFCKAIQVPFSPRGGKEFQKKCLSIAKMQTYVEESSSSAEFEYESVRELRAVTSEENGGRMRKHHKLWTLGEVRMLIDGVSEYGVGKWTQIKKLLFSSSPHRTPVDLKDKWRNLLKASNAQNPNTGEDDKKRNQPWRPLPKSMLRRVRELAAIYPYPRGNRRKFDLSLLN